MKITVPIELNVNLTPDEIIQYLRNWVYSLLNKYGNVNDSDRTVVVRNGKLFWHYHKTYFFNGGVHYSEGLYDEIIIEDPVIFNICKNAIELLNSYERLDQQLKKAGFLECLKN